MAHDIASINGINSIAYIGETPWHRLGQVLQSGASLDDAFAAAALDWDVDALPSFVRVGPEGDTREVKLATQAIVRQTDGIVLGEVGPRYQPIQHRTAFRVFEPALAASQLQIEVVGALGKGEIVWLLLRLAEEGQTIRVQADGSPDRVLPYVLAQTSHDGTRQFTVKPTAIRVVCRNTLNASGDPRADAWINIRHTDSADAQIQQVGVVLERAAEQYRATCDLFRQLAAAVISEGELLDYIAEVLPMPKAPKSLVQIAGEQGAAAANALLKAGNVVPVLDAPPAVLDEKEQTRQLRYKTEVARIEAERVTIATLATEGKGNGGNSLWDAYNGVTEFVDHTARRNTEYAIKRAAINAIAGDGEALKTQAFQLAIQRAGAKVAA